MCAFCFSFLVCVHFCVCAFLMGQKSHFRFYVQLGRAKRKMGSQFHGLWSRTEAIHQKHCIKKYNQKPKNQKNKKTDKFRRDRPPKKPKQQKTTTNQCSIWKPRKPDLSLKHLRNETRAAATTLSEIAAGAKLILKRRPPPLDHPSRRAVISVLRPKTAVNRANFFRSEPPPMARPTMTRPNIPQEAATITGSPFSARRY